MNTNEIVSKLWNLCNVLRDDGITYQDYVTELASLLFIKMCDELEDKQELLPEGMRWHDLKAKNGLDQLQFYRRMLVELGEDEHSIVRAIFANVNTNIDKPKHLQELIAGMDKLDWYGSSREDFGDMYEGLLEKNAGETKSGAGQYFTPRPLIDTMTALLQPTFGEVIQDPASGTAGFLISADRFIKHETDDLDDLSQPQIEFQQRQAFQGIELVSGTRRLALMNCLLHDIEGPENSEGPIMLGNTLSGDGETLAPADVILTNPPFGSAKGAGVSREFTHMTQNKQLAFMQHIYTNLKPGGRAAVVIPDNVLFESGAGTRIRQDLMDKCNLHTILRLPTGIFYAQGVKTNVLFFQKGTPENPAQDKGCTKETWVFDMRTNMNSFGKRTPLTEKHFEAFINAYGADKNGQSAREEGVYETLGNIFAEGEEAVEHVIENARFRKFSRDYIRDQKGDSLDISWLKDLAATSAENLPEPEVLAGEAMAELTEAMSEIYQLMQALGANDEAEGQKQLLEEAFGLAEKPEAE
ncbi:N-6 DNA methylase [Vibrio genomosp. F10 str. 9ZC157]|uniref:site-specific DNA-methyltransferase (adenine-specific) n=1 Tax=Vibrio genomosp. F10 str. ZF-129 TaxID=1187848 RepID=A0A1E5BCM5_9VIBR|nr:N-6 DNA methylase [Vibrio genomosp. F10]OEE32334.1 SAM-dependent methyltransferase [Vibrio genomosp. F10 str. ZF-129]OEE98126.1 SAM-dependent methyltransferase [Vibrio genomosp. F10 str. 9ZC157]